jgi:hypothetical protein
MGMVAEQNLVRAPAAARTLDRPPRVPAAPWPDHQGRQCRQGRLDAACPGRSPGSRELIAVTHPH